jgi:hypothetical protein
MNSITLFPSEVQDTQELLARIPKLSGGHVEIIEGHRASFRYTLDHFQYVDSGNALTATGADFQELASAGWVVYRWEDDGVEFEHPALLHGPSDTTAPIASAT